MIDSGNVIPRRCHVDKMVLAERGIRAAMHTVEAMGADTRPTDAIVLLTKAQELVADFVDGVERAPSGGFIPLNAINTKALMTAMQDAWNDHCANTGCYPPDIEAKRGKLFFTPKYWASETARILRERAIAGDRP